MVGNVANLVAIDEAVEAWDNLEYARLQVRLRKLHLSRVSKRIHINGLFIIFFWRKRCHLLLKVYVIVRRKT